jgi:ferredoxin-type protein NapH
MGMRLKKRIRNLVLLLSLLTFPVTIFYFSPLTSLYGASIGIVAGSVTSFALQFLSSILFGRAFCGWLCPAGAAQEAVFGVNDRRAPVAKIRWIKFAIWTPWIAGLVFFFLKAQGQLSYDFFFGTQNGISAISLETYFVYFIVLAVFLSLALIVGKRAACHSICWMAPFMILGKKLGSLLRIPALRLRVDNGNCTSCGACTSTCPMSLPVREMVASNSMENSDCILCGSCTADCARKVIRFSFSRQKIY